MARPRGGDPHLQISRRLKRLPMAVRKVDLRSPGDGWGGGNGDSVDANGSVAFSHDIRSFKKTPVSLRNERG